MRSVNAYGALVVATCGLASCAAQPSEPPLTKEDVRRIVDDVVGKSEQQAIDKAAKTTEQQIASLRGEVKQLIDLEALRRSGDFAKLSADDSKSKYQQDLDRAAVLDGKDLLMFMDIAKKRKAGEELTDDELRLAFQFHEFREYIRPALEDRAKRRGLVK